MRIEGLFDIRGKRALVTGASGGIGAMIAEGLVSAGASVTICSRKPDALEETAARLSTIGEVHAIPADLARGGDIERLADAVNAAGPLDILVNNAGTTWGAGIDDFPRAGFEKVIGLNLTAVFDLTRALLPSLRRAGRPEDPARVINIASIDGMRVPIWESYAYSASKAGLIHMSRHLGKRLARDHVSVNVIAPGVFPSRMTSSVYDLEDREAHPELFSPLGGRVGVPEDIAGAVIFLSSRAGAWLTGVTLPVSGGLGTIE